MFFNPFIIPAVLIGISTCQELMFTRMIEGYNQPKKKEIKEVPKGYYVCFDCGKICKRLNASQKRCTECQIKHRKELERNRKRSKK